MDDMKGRRIRKARARPNFEHYSNQCWRELARELGRDDPELRGRLEGLGQHYLRHRDFESWLSTPIERAMALDKLLTELARAQAVFVNSGVVLTGGKGIMPGMTVEDHLRSMREEVQRLKDSAEPVVYEKGETGVSYLDPPQLKLPAPAQEYLDKSQSDIDLHEAWANVVEKTERMLRARRAALADPPRRQPAENRDETERNIYFGGVFNLWCDATGAAPPIEGRWRHRRAAIAFLNVAAEPVIGKLSPTAIRNWLTTYVKQERRWAKLSEGLPDWKLVSVHQYEG
jgi:hypothetical protein